MKYKVAGSFNFINAVFQLGFAFFIYFYFVSKFQQQAIDFGMERSQLPEFTLLFIVVLCLINFYFAIKLLSKKQSNKEKYFGPAVISCVSTFILSLVVTSYSLFTLVSKMYSLTQSL
jgi:hypothetical protein